MEQITATWARDTAIKVLGDKVKKEIEGCDGAIRKAVSENKLTTTIDLYIETLTKENLEQRGFEIKRFSDQREGSYTVINW